MRQDLEARLQATASPSRQHDVDRTEEEERLPS